MNRLSNRFKKRMQTSSATILPRTAPYQGAIMKTTQHEPLNIWNGPSYSKFVGCPSVEGAPVHFCVWTVAYSNDQYNIFGTVARNVADSLRQLGYSVEESHGSAPPRRTGQPIVFGVNIMQDMRLLPHNAIIYQLEQIGSRWMHEGYLNALRTHIVWDFSVHNVAELRKRGCPRAFLCRIGSSAHMPSVVNQGKDIDVLFYGSSNPRRKAAIDALRARGLNVHDGGGWGAALDALIARSKVLLNVHYYPDAVLEMVRLSYALERSACIVTEVGADPALEQALGGGIVVAPYDLLVQTVVNTVAASQAERDQIANRGRNAFAALSCRREVERVIGECLPEMKSKRIKCYINNRDRLAWTKAIAQQIVRLGGEPIIIDNASTYPPLLQWYSTECPHRVVRLAQNIGARAPWLSGVLDRDLVAGDLYVVTDPDLDLSKVPADALSVLARGFCHGARKVGLSLELDDVPRSLLNTMQVNGLTLEQIERGYWTHRLDGQFYKADVDTTFAMYRHGGQVPMDHTFYSGVRADRPYTARHLPWYRTQKDFDDEDRYYVAHRQVTGVNGTWYDSVRAAGAP